MASDSDSDSASAFLEQLINSRNRDLSFSLPMILGFSSSSRRDSAADQDGSDEHPRDRIVLINPLTQGMIVIETSRSIEDLIRDFAGREGPKPASKSSIEAMPTVVIAEDDRGEGECSICLEDWMVGEEAREMPCKHRYHSGCIEKWLGVHGSCPLCRYKMPEDDEEEDKKVTSESSDRGDVWVTFAFNGSTGEGEGDGVGTNESSNRDEENED